MYDVRKMPAGKVSSRRDLHLFTYDAMLRRSVVQDSGGVRYFTWDSNGMNLLCERNSSGGTIAYYTHGYTSTDGIGSLVATKREEAGASYYQYPICDAIKGNVVRLVDENGTPVAYYEYDAWGNDLRDDIVGGIGTNRFRYQSNWIQLTDDPSNVLKLTPTRLYHAGVGRFLGRDPVPTMRVGRTLGQYATSALAESVVATAAGQVEPSGKSRYAYADWMPDLKVDPTGLWKSGTHRRMTKDLFERLQKKLGWEDPYGGKVIEWMRRWSSAANTRQDIAAMLDTRRHYGRKEVEEELVANEELVALNAVVWDLKYELYTLQAENRYMTLLLEASRAPSRWKGMKICTRALEELGRLLHSWQDFYAHAIQPRQGAMSVMDRWKAWIGEPKKTGNPKERAGFWPCSFPTAEHALFTEPLSRNGLKTTERPLREEAAKEWTADAAEPLLAEWWRICECLYREIDVTFGVMSDEQRQRIRRRDPRDLMR